MLLGSTLAQSFSAGHKDVADAEEGADDSGECRRLAGDGYKVPGEVGGDEDAPTPATDKVGPKHSEKHSKKSGLGREQLTNRMLGIGRSDKTFPRHLNL